MLYFLLREVVNMTGYKQELKKFKEFKKTYDFKQLEIVDKNISYLCVGIVI